MALKTDQQVVAHVLKVLADEGVTLDKIVVQKFMYFLQSRGILSGFKFVPFTYGPFSFELAETLDDMALWGDIDVSHNAYTVKDLTRHGTSPVLARQLTEELQRFRDAAGNDLRFGSMELLGTMLYCAHALKMVGEPITKDAIIRDVIEWKGDKYSDQLIGAAYDRIKPFLPAN